jgi:hypothetical protein
MALQGVRAASHVPSPPSDLQVLIMDFRDAVGCHAEKCVLLSQVHSESF